MDLADSYYPSLQIRYELRTTVRVSDEWLSVCIIRFATGYKPQGQSDYIHLAKSNRYYYNQISRYKGLEWDIVEINNDFPNNLFDPNMDNAAFRDEVNLLYVSATRAKKTLVINKLLVNILAKVAENEKTAQA
ncbi:3'-5' exonuclease [Arsenophonus sp. PmNCSU2021_1]|uniref:3'-5' exonuclease n=1 Tax=Arsenophonus sp. PmNCSU2021_1 TaxID=3118989 RepID=UPI002FF23FA9